MSKNELSIVSSKLQVAQSLFGSNKVRTAYNTQTNTLYVCLVDLERESGLKRDTSTKYISIFQSKDGYQNLVPRIELETEDGNGIPRPTAFVSQTLANFLIPKGNSDSAIDFSFWLAKVATELQTSGFVDLRPAKTPMEMVLESIQFLQTEVAKERALKEEAIRTKALISDKKTATALATASHAVQAKNKAEAKAEELAIQLSQSQQWITVLVMEKKFGQKFDWRPLKKWHVEKGIGIKKVNDERYGEVSAYHKDAWKEVYGKA